MLLFPGLIVRFVALWPLVSLSGSVEKMWKPVDSPEKPMYHTGDERRE